MGQVVLSYTCVYNPEPEFPSFGLSLWYLEVVFMKQKVIELSVEKPQAEEQMSYITY